MELRATTNLCRVYQARGESAAARGLLALALDAIPTEFAGLDLDDARHLAEELGA